MLNGIKEGLIGLFIGVERHYRGVNRLFLFLTCDATRSHSSAAIALQISLRLNTATVQADFAIAVWRWNPARSPEG